MAVKRGGLFRALLVAHAQMMVNRTRKGLGRRGLLGLVAVLLILITAAVPLLVTFGFLGFIFGRAAGEPLVPPLMGGVLFGTTVGFGVVGGLLGGARQLTWDAYRSFPVPFRTLFFAETFASLGDLVVMGFIGVTFAMGAAFAWERPTATLLLFLLLGQAVVWVLFAQHLVGALAVTAVRRLRRAMVVLVVAAWAGVSVLAGAARELRDDMHGAELERLRDLWHGARPVVDVLPPVLAVRGIVAFLEHRYERALRLTLPMLVTTLILGSISYALLRREALPRNLNPAGSPSDERRFRGKDTPRRVMARLHLHHIIGSLQGRFGLVVPLITVVLIKGPLAAGGIGPELSLPGSIIYLALASTQFHFNQFGLDGQGVKTLFLLPVPMRDVLLGKTYGLLAYIAIQNAFLLALLVVIVRPRPEEMLSVTLLAASLAFAQLLEGHWISAMYPRPLAMHRMNSTGLSGANLLPLGVGMVNAAVFGGLYAVVSWQTPAERMTILFSLLLTMIAVYRTLLPRAARFVESRRETVVNLLG